MYSKHLTTIVAGIAAILVIPVLGQMTHETSSSARQSLVKIAAAIKDGDADFVKSHIAWSTPGQKQVVENQARSCAAAAEFRKAYGEAFGEAALAKLPPMVGPTTVPANTKVTENGDTAVVEFSAGVQFKMVRQDGTWKLDYSALAVNALPLSDEQLAGYLNRTLLAMNQVTLGLQLGKYKTPAECLTELRRLTIQAAHEPAATQPAK